MLKKCYCTSNFPFNFWKISRAGVADSKSRCSHSRAMVYIQQISWELQKGRSRFKKSFYKWQPIAMNVKNKYVQRFSFPFLLGHQEQLVLPAQNRIKDGFWGITYASTWCKVKAKMQTLQFKTELLNSFRLKPQNPAMYIYYILT